MASQKRCDRFKGLPVINQTCKKGTRRCPRKVGKCVSKKLDLQNADMEDIKFYAK